MIVLGISALDKESTATIVRDGSIVAAVSEERLTRIKQQAGFPTGAVEAVLRLSGVSVDEIDLVAYPFFDAGKELRMVGRSAGRDVLRAWHKIRHRGIEHTLRHYGALTKLIGGAFYRKLSTGDRELSAGLAALGLSSRLRRYDHQYCHAVGAYHNSGFERALVITLDWYGSGKAGSVYLAEAGRLRLLEEIPFPNSVGILYSAVTGALGFTPDRHEGKVVGLAALGNPATVAPVMMSRFLAHDDGFEFLDPLDSSNVRAVVSRHSREDVAAGVQETLETVVLRLVRHHVRASGVSRIAAAGGIFANVKMNQKIALLPEVEELFVDPGMTDVGTGTGAAIAAAREAGDILPPAGITSVFLGPDYDGRAVDAALAGSGLSVTRIADMPRRIAELLAAEKVVARFHGRMEYGPRALGHRSVLANTRDRRVTDVLNERLKRNDFMPFAPATLEEAADECYIGAEKVRHAARFMTVCLPCRPKMLDLSPAAVHVDNTARPQFVSRESNPDLYSILQHVQQMTGVPSVINTSFNIHEEPIVCSPADAVRGFVDGALDYLAIEDLLVSRT